MKAWVKAAGNREQGRMEPIRAWRVKLVMKRRRKTGMDHVKWRRKTIDRKERKAGLWSDWPTLAVHPNRNGRNTN